MAKKPLPTPEVLRQLLRYEPETGRLFWKERSPQWFPISQRPQSVSASAWNAKFADKEAFCTLQSQGYYEGRIFNSGFLAHRVAWAIWHGRWPDAFIDHINCDRKDNRICNLREADNGQNMQNRGPQKNTTTGIKGVYFDNENQKWRAMIAINGRSKCLGRYGDKNEAAAAYADAAAKYHGEFAWRA